MTIGLDAFRDVSPDALGVVKRDRWLRSDTLVSMSPKGRLGNREIQQQRLELAADPRAVAGSRKAAALLLQLIEQEYGAEAAQAARQAHTQADEQILSGRTVQAMLRAAGADQPNSAPSEYRPINQGLAVRVLNGRGRVKGKGIANFEQLLDRSLQEVQQEMRGLRGDGAPAFHFGKADVSDDKRLLMRRTIAQRFAEQRGPLSAKQAQALAKNVIADTLRHDAELKAGLLPPADRADKTASGAVRNTLARLCPRAFSPRRIGLAAADMAGALRRQLDLEAAADPRLHGNAYDRRHAELIDAEVGKLDDWQLRRAYANLSAQATQGVLTELVVQQANAPSNEDMDTKLARQSVAAGSYAMLGLRESLGRELAKRNLTAPEPTGPVGVVNRSVEDPPAQTAARVVSAHAQARAKERVVAANDFLRVAGRFGSDGAPAMLDALNRFDEAAFGQSFAEERTLGTDLFRAMLEPELAKLSNKELLEQYRNTMSSQMLDLRLALSQHSGDKARALASLLNEYEAAVTTALLERSKGVTQAPPRPTPDLQAHDLEVLAEASRAAFKRDLAAQDDRYLAAKPGQQWRTDPGVRQNLVNAKVQIDPKEAGKLLRDSDLTVNMDLSVLFGSDKPGVKADGSFDPQHLKLKNLFDLTPAQRRELSKGRGYMEKRQTVEHAQFPALARTEQGQDVDRLRGSLHPISTALDPGHVVVGAASGSGYGCSALVLKDQVKQRATFTPMDSFYALDQEVTKERIDDFFTQLDQLMPGLNKVHREYLASNRAAMRHILEQNIGRDFKLPHKRADMVDGLLVKHLDKLHGDDKRRVETLILRSFGKGGQQHVTTQNRMHQLLKGMDQPELEQLEKIQGIERPTNLQLNEYIEAQVWGGIDLTKDVKAIRHYDIGDEDTTDNLLRFGRQHNIPVQVISPEQSLKSGSLPQLATFPDPDRPVDHSLDAVKREMPALLADYEQHEQSFDPQGIHGREHVCRCLIYSHAMANYVESQGVPVNRHALYRATLLHDAGRKRNGADVFEADSAAKAREYMKRQGITDQQYLDHLGRAIDKKSAKGAATVESMILNSADSLDIMRVRGRDGYDPDLLEFGQGDVKVGDKDLAANDWMREQMIVEADRLIEATRPRTKAVARYEKAVADFKQAANADDPDWDLLEELSKKKAAAQRAMNEELKALNAKTASRDYYERMESVLLKNPKRFPLLHHFYAMSNGPMLQAPRSSSKGRGQAPGIAPKRGPKGQVRRGAPLKAPAQVRSNAVSGVQSRFDSQSPRVRKKVDSDVLDSSRTSGQAHQALGTLGYDDLGRLLSSAGKTRPQALETPAPVAQGKAFFQEAQQGRRCGEHALKNYAGGAFFTNDQLTDFAAATRLHGYPQADKVERRIVDGTTGNDAEVLRDYLNWQIARGRLDMAPVGTTLIKDRHDLKGFEPSGDRCIIQTQNPSHFIAFRREAKTGKWRRLDSFDARKQPLTAAQPYQSPSEYLQQVIDRQDAPVQVIQPLQGAAASRALAHAMLLDEATGLDAAALTLLRRRLDDAIKGALPPQQIRSLVGAQVAEVKQLRANPVTWHQSMADAGLTDPHGARAHLLSDLMARYGKLTWQERDAMIKESLVQFEREQQLPADTLDLEAELRLLDGLARKLAAAKSAEQPL